MTTTINAPYADHRGHLDPLDPHIIPALDHDPTLTTHGAVFPTLTARPTTDGLNVEVFDPATSHRVAVNLDAAGVASLHRLLSDVLHTP